MSLRKMIIIMGLFLLLAGCSSANKIYNIEAENNYDWQKFMNEEEFNKVQEGMSYMEVVEVAKGAGEVVNGQTYLWPDEILLTHAYEIKFKEDKVVEKNIVERRGNSTRGVEESEEAPESNVAGEPNEPNESTE